MISVIIPTYKNPAYLDICLRSAIDGQTQKNEIIVIVDGFTELSTKVLAKYDGEWINVLAFKDNQGMQMALNFGVFNATSEKIFIMNDDNIFPKNWDVALEKVYDEDIVTTVNQIEPQEGIFHFPVLDCGITAETFDYEKFSQYEQQIAQERFTENGRIFPFLISKKWYMAIGGFDTLYKSPFYCDLDVWVKLELAGLSFRRYHGSHFYHFGSRATKNRTDTDAAAFQQSENPAAQTFFYKWKSLIDVANKVMKARVEG